MITTGYPRLRDGYLLDWHLFRQLPDRGEESGRSGSGSVRWRKEEACAEPLETVRGSPGEGKRDHQRPLSGRRHARLRVASRRSVGSAASAWRTVDR
jgi:hypothetical protein